MDDASSADRRRTRVGPRIKCGSTNSAFTIGSVLHDTNFGVDTSNNSSNGPGFNDIVASCSSFASKGAVGYMIAGPAINLIVAYTSPREGEYDTMPGDGSPPSDFSRRLIVDYDINILPKFWAPCREGDVKPLRFRGRPMLTGNC